MFKDKIFGDDMGLVDNVKIGDEMRDRKMTENLIELPTASKPEQVDDAYRLSMRTPSGKGEIVFIDPSVPDYRSQLAHLEDRAEVVILDDWDDGVNQIAAELKYRRDLTHIHILAEGMPGMVLLGSASLCATTFGLYSKTIAKWGQSLDVTGEICFYGSTVGQSDSGEYFLRRISDLAQASVSATSAKISNILRMVA